MSPDEVRRLLNADSYSTDPLKQVTGRTPMAPVQPAPTTAAGKSDARRTSSESLQSFAAQLMSARSDEQVKAIEHVSLGLPDFREASAQEVRQAEQLLRDAAMLRRREKYNEAETKCREALTLVPKDAAALELLGDLFQGVARIDEALAAYKRAVEADPKRSSAERKYGELLVQQQRWGGPDPEAVPVNPKAATLLSALLPGLGQFHNGEIGKGVFFLIADAVCFYLLAFSPYGFAGEHHRSGLNTSLFACLILTAVIYFAAVIDANVVARQGGRKRRGGSGWDV
jgi:tetratricopeptide (TPR) repeat protein